jgi:hypothetical protein
MDHADMLKTLESAADHGVRLVGNAIEVFGVLIIVTGIAWSTLLHLRRPTAEQDSQSYITRFRSGDRCCSGWKCLSPPTS